LRVVLAIIAVVYLGCFGYVTTRRTLYQISATQAFDAAPGTSPSNSVHHRLLGRIAVPRLDVSAIVDEGTDENTLALAVGHIPGTALPGSSGNVAVAAHRDTFFRPLKDLRTDDEIDFTTDQGEFRYRVTSMRIVDPDNVEVLRPSSDPELTMITCYPFEFFGHAPKRFIVQARQIPPRSL
jgi:sortase A